MVTTVMQSPHFKYFLSDARKRPQTKSEPIVNVRRTASCRLEYVVKDVKGLDPPCDADVDFMVPVLTLLGFRGGGVPR